LLIAGLPTVSLCWEPEQEKPKGSLLPLFFYFLSPYKSELLTQIENKKTET
jgi:hypothetical protein